MNDFSFLTNLSDFSRQSSSWSRSSGTFETGFTSTYWSINTSSDNREKGVMLDIPIDIQEMYPNLFLDEISYNSTALFFRTGSYEDFIFRKHESLPSTRDNFISEEIVIFR